MGVPMEEGGYRVRESFQGNNSEHSGFMDRIMKPLESNGGDGVWINILDFSGHMHPRLGGKCQQLL